MRDGRIYRMRDGKRLGVRDWISDMVRDAMKEE